MAVGRSPYQGVFNVVRFNWHFYAFAGSIAVALAFSSLWMGQWGLFFAAASLVIFVSTLVTLVVTYYVYDYSDLYSLPWLDVLFKKAPSKILNVNAGFDETSVILSDKFTATELSVCDFYDPEFHTEISIKRAREANPPYPRTITVKTNSLPYADEVFELVNVTFAAHEIRNGKERQQFFLELNRVLSTDGKIVVTEHLRDLPNFMAYTIGFLHFYSKSSWLEVFGSSNLRVQREWKTTPFVRTFILTKNGVTP